MQSKFTLAFILALLLAFSTGCPPTNVCNTTVCGAVSALQVIDSTTQTLTVSWDNATSATAFQLKAINQNGVAVITDTINASFGLMTYTFAGLTPATSYTLKVTTLCGTCVGDEADVKGRTLLGGPLIVIEDNVDMILHCQDACFDNQETVTIPTGKYCYNISVSREQLSTCKVLVIAWKSDSNTYFWDNDIRDISYICNNINGDKYIFTTLTAPFTLPLTYRIEGLVPATNYQIWVKTLADKSCLTEGCTKTVKTPSCP